MPESPLAQPLKLPCGAVLPNRLAKAAMTEGLADDQLHATHRHETLYSRWSDGGAGLLITGNIMIDRRHTGEPNNVVLEDARDMALLKRWANAGKSQGNDIWVQLNHPGKQIPRMLASGDTLAPSAVPFGKELKSAFKTPRALTEDEIFDIIRRFASSATLAKEAGFTGVQIHGAHGYLVSQFLSGHHNRRSDKWGGSLENRMRFPLEIYRAIREAVGPEYPVSIKLNSADFQRGGFTEEESMTVAETLAAEGLDLLEISGGNYENPAMAGARGVRESTVKREAYFLDYAQAIRQRVSTPLMVTGGFRSAQAMAQAVESGATDLVGIARPLAVEPDLANRILAGQEGVISRVTPRKTGIKMIDEMAMMEVSWFSRQLHRMGKGQDPKPDESVLLSLFKVVTEMGIGNFKTRRLRANS